MNFMFQQESTSHFVLVESACTNLQNLAIAVAFQSPVLLEGPIGCGKTSLIEYLAAATGRTKPPHILKVQLGDQTDSKVSEETVLWSNDQTCLLEVWTCFSNNIKFNLSLKELTTLNSL